MFNSKNKTDLPLEKATSGNGTTIIGRGTTLKGDIESTTDLRIDGSIVGNIKSKARVVIGADGSVKGDISGTQVDVVGKVDGNIRAEEMLQLRGEATVNGNLHAAKLQIEPTASFNGQCHMGPAQVVEMERKDKEINELAKVASK